MADDTPPVASGGKRLFVTIGATAPFNSLIRGVLAHGFLSALQSQGYSELRIQHGDEGAHILREADPSNIRTSYGIDVTGFAFKTEGLTGEMRALKSTNVEREGAIISHAGSGSVLDALRLSVPLVVVPNSDLLHNHQVELAETLDHHKYVVYGKIE
jgi:beta-1,4-N-acetylglucosaminyltransferase